LHILKQKLHILQVEGSKIAKKINNNHPSFIYADRYQSLDKFVHRSAEEMRSMRHQMANTDTDDTEVF